MTESGELKGEKSKGQLNRNLFTELKFSLCTEVKAQKEL